MIQGIFIMFEKRDKSGVGIIEVEGTSLAAMITTGLKHLKTIGNCRVLSIRKLRVCGRCGHFMCSVCGEHCNKLLCSCNAYGGCIEARDMN